jgi:hypothetical protein
MQRFLFFITGWIVFTVLASVLMQTVSPVDTSSDPDKFGTIILAKQNPLFQKILRAYREKNHVYALSLIDKHQHEFAEQAITDAELGFHFFHLKGHVHSSVWQHIEAEQSWQKALTYTDDRRVRSRLSKLIKTRQRLIHDINAERDLKGIYHASPNVGPAAALKGKIVVIYIFLTDSALQSWSLRKRDFVMQNWGHAENWLQAKASKYGASLSFERRLFVIDKNPYIKRLRVADFNKSFVNAEKVAQLAAKELGYDNMMLFVEEIKRQENAEQAALLIHLARDGRSFASRCMYRCPPDAEYVYLMEKPDYKYWQSMGYAQAHEALHLFGADDLYNIDKARNYAVRDIMNYPASILEVSTLDDITAYATGLTHKKPKTPFYIKDYIPGRE